MKRPRAKKTRTAKKTPLDGRARILRAAIRRFAEDGFDSTSTVAIARDAGVSQPDVHHHFSSKRKLWEAAVDEIFARFLRAGAKLTPPPSGANAEDHARTLFTNFVVAASELTDLPKLIAREGGTRSSRLDYLVDHHVGPLLRGSADLLRNAQRAGVIRRGYPPELLLFLFLGAADHVFTVRALVKAVFDVDVDDATTREEFARMYVDVMLRGVSPVP